MWSTEASRKTICPKNQIWKLWTDVKNWKTWDKDVKYSELFGAFKSGTRGIIKPSDGPKIQFTIIEIRIHEAFINRSYLPLCVMDFIHTMAETKDGLIVTHKVTMNGFLSFIFSKIIGNKIKNGLPSTIESLITIAEQNK